VAKTGETHVYGYGDGIYKYTGIGCNEMFA
jgi:hypothetical protein